MARTKSLPKARKKLGGVKTEDGHRRDKVDAVAYLTDKLQSSAAVFLTEYRGLTVKELADLRVALSKQDAEYKVAKNTLARIAVKQAGFEDLTAMLEGPVAIAFAGGDAVLTAKELSEFAKKSPALIVKGALMEGVIYDEAGAKRLASLESREVMLAKAAGMFITPIQQTANVFAAGLNQFGAVLAAYKDKLAASGDAA